MPVLYDSKKIIPAPFVTISKEVSKTQDGTTRNRLFKINVKGNIVAFAGSPDHTGTFWTSSGYPPNTPEASSSDTKRLACLREKMGAISQLFETEGKWFEIQPYDGSSPIKFKPRVNSIVFEEGNWYDKVPYNISLEADCIYYGATEICYIGQTGNEPEETWQIEAADDQQRSYRLTHQVSAQGKKQFDNNGNVLCEGWELARAIVLGDQSLAGSGAVSYLGFSQDQMIASGVLNLNDFQPFNHIKSQSIDEANGKFSVTETWLCFNPDDNFGTTAGKVIEELNAEIRYTADSGFSSVSLSGTITGLEERDLVTDEVTVTKWENAQLRMAEYVSNGAILYNRALAYSGLTLNPQTASSTRTANEKSGVITYQIEYNTRPAPSNLSYLSETVSYSINYATDIVAQIACIGRAAGPVLQDTGASTQQQITVTAEIAVSVNYNTTPTAPTFNSLAAALSVIGTPTQMFCTSDTVNWTPANGRYSRATTYIWQ